MDAGLLIAVGLGAFLGGAIGTWIAIWVAWKSV